MHRLASLILVLWSSVPLGAQSGPEVTNVVANPLDTAGQVRITYDLSLPGGTATVIVRVSDDGGTSFAVPAASFSGDVGAGVVAGTGRQILWDAAADLPFGFSGDWQVKVIAIEGDGRLLEVDLPGGATMLFARIEPGTFLMGTPSAEAGRRAEEGPQQQVTISRAFYMGVHEITRTQWARVMGEDPPTGTAADLPQGDISWDDLQAFLQIVNSAADGVFRLPTEAEWEYAARAGSGAAWSFGGDDSALATRAWYDANAGGQAHAVGAKRINAFGLYDMHGNVWEWVQDSYGPYSGLAQTDPRIEGGSTRVFRGGGFTFPADRTRSGGRGNNVPLMRAPWLGGRLLLEAP